LILIFHEAIDRYQVPSEKSNTIIEVYETGYSIKEKVLRPARVIVGFCPDSTAKPPAPEPPAPVPGKIETDNLQNDESATSIDGDAEGLHSEDESSGDTKGNN
jgi:hypothetical protein